MANDLDGLPLPWLSNSTLDDELVEYEEVSIQYENGLEPGNGSESCDLVTFIKFIIDDMMNI